MRKVVVVGAGIGGLSVAIRLAARGWRVSVYDKQREPGGRMSTVSTGGYRWDCGPTLIMMPEVLRDLFAAAGRRLEDYLDLRRVDPYYRVRFEEGAHLDLTGDLPRLVANVEAIEPGAGERVLRFLGHAEWLYGRTRRSIIERVFDGPGDVLRPGVLWSMLRAQPRASVWSLVCAHFRSEFLRRAFSFQTLYLGTRPERTPAPYVMIPFVEAAFGVWYPMGGIHQIARALARLAGELGVEIHLGASVERVATRGDRVVGVALEGGAHDAADVVVTNADWGHVQSRLLPRGAPVTGRDHGASGLLFLFAVRRRLEGPHHTFILSSDFEGNLADIFDRRRLPEQPSVYVSRPTATDPSLAPAGTELLYVLVPCPTLAAGIDWEREVPLFRKRVLDRLALTGLEDLEADVVAETVLTPATFASRYNLTQGSAFGLAATLLQSGPFRPAIRSPRWSGLYHVGASTHPGGGVPIVATSGRMAAEAIERDVAGRRLMVATPARRDAEAP